MYSRFLFLLLRPRMYLLNSLYICDVSGHHLFMYCNVVVLCFGLCFVLPLWLFSLSLSVISSDRYEHQLCLIKTKLWEWPGWLMRWELVDKAEVERQEAESLSSCPSMWLLSLFRCVGWLLWGPRAWVCVTKYLFVKQSNLCILCWMVSFKFLCLYLILEALERWSPFSFANCVFACFWSDREWGKSYVYYVFFFIC